MGDSCIAVFCKNGYDRKPKVLSEHSPSAQLLRGNRSFSIGLLLPMLLAALVLAQGFAQGETSELNSAASSVQMPPDGEGIESLEAADGQEAIDEAEEMDQLIQTISDSGEADGCEIEEAAESFGTADTEEIVQPTMGPEDGSGSAAEVEQSPESIEDAEEIDQLIQTIEDDSSGSEGAALSSGTSDVTATGQSLNAPEDSSGSTAGADQGLETVKKAEGMAQLIQTIEDDSNRAKTAIARQTEIQEKTESISLLIQILADYKSSTDVTTTKSTETIGKTKSIDQTIQTLEGYGDKATSSNEVAGGQDIEIADEGNSMERMIQDLEESSI